MKFIVMTALITILSSNSYANFSLSCPQIYEKVMVSKNIKKNKAENIGYQLNGAGVVMSLGGAPLLTALLLLPASGLIVYSAFSPKEEKVLNLAEESSHELEKLTKKLRKEIHPDITEQDILSIVEEGLVSGTFCWDFPKLKGPKQIRKHVAEILKEKYLVAQ
jgi:hypothetical protein